MTLVRDFARVAQQPRFWRENLRLEETSVVYHLLGETGWSTVVINGTSQIPNRNFHGDTLVPLPRNFPGR